MSSLPAVHVRALTSSDEARWRELFRGYRDFYKMQHDTAVIDRVWGWLHDPHHVTRGYVAEVDGQIQGIAHVRTYPSPLRGVENLFLDDLFTDPAARGKGVARALLNELATVAAAEGGQVVRWITAHDNTQAQYLYDQVATKLGFYTYDMPAAK